MSRKDRERARRRHAIEKARREAAGEEPAPAPGRPGRSGTPAKPPKREATTRPGGARRPAAGTPKSREEIRAAYRAQFERKGKVGDIDPRGRPRTRDMLVHPKITRLVVLLCMPVALLGLFQPRLQLLTWFAYVVAFLGLADLARTKLWAAVMATLGAAALLMGTLSLLAIIRA